MRRILQLSLALLALGGLAASSQASAIHATNKWAWSESAGYLNFKATNATVSSAFAATVQPGSNGYLTGWAWSEMLGWIKLGNTNGGLPYANTDATNWGVNVAGSNLSGFAWSESAGWINFAPTSATVSARATFRVADGQFDGYAWSELAGWVHVRGTLYALDALTVPVAGSVTLWRATNQLLKVTEKMLLTNTVDPDGSVMTVVWVSPASTNGGTVDLSGRWTTYVPPVDDNSPDYFTFRVQNAIGGEAEGTATVITSTPADNGSQTLNFNAALVGGNVELRIFGIPGRTYIVQGATRLIDPDWSNLGEFTIGAGGYVDFTETNPRSPRFYRTVKP